MKQLLDTINIFIIYSSSEHSTTILDTEMNNYHYHLGINKVIKNLCRDYEKDFHKLKGNSCKLLDIKQKPPLMIKPKQLILFPLFSYRDNENVFINYEKILKIKAVGYEYTLIELKNGRRYCLHSNIRKIRRQLRRCHFLCQNYY